MHTVTLNINDNAYNHLMYFVSNTNNDIEIIEDEVIQDLDLDIEVVTEDDPDYQIILRGREERITHPENYGTLDDIDWD